MTTKEKNNYKGILSTDRKTILLIAKSLLIGTLAGLAVVAYRFVLSNVEELSFVIYRSACGHLPLLILLFVFLPRRLWNRLSHEEMFRRFRFVLCQPMFVFSKQFSTVWKALIHGYSTAFPHGTKAFHKVIPATLWKTFSPQSL